MALLEKSKTLYANYTIKKIKNFKDIIRTRYIENTKELDIIILDHYVIYVNYTIK